MKGFQGQVLVVKRVFLLLMGIQIYFDSSRRIRKLSPISKSLTFLSCSTYVNGYGEFNLKVLIFPVCPEVLWEELERYQWCDL